MSGSRSARLSKVLAAGVSLIALGYCQVSLAQQSAQSDQPTAGQASGLDEITVTARRKEEKAQSVPITMTNFSPQFLQQQEINRLQDLTVDTPGLSLANAAELNSYIYMRGVPGVLAYWDEVPVNFANAAFYFDLDSVQVLKGPQGTLFGIATNGGAVLINTKKPTGSFEGYASAEVGDYGHYLLEGAINIPIVDNKLLLRVSGKLDHTDGYQNIINLNEQKGDNDYQVERVQLTFSPTDDITNEFAANYYSERDHGIAWVTTLIDPNGLAAQIYGAKNILAYQWPNQGRYNAIEDISSYESYRELNLRNSTRWDASENLTIKNILGYQEFISGGNQGNSSGTPFPLYDATSLPYRATQSTLDQGQVSEELQAQGKLFDDKLSYTVGTFNQWSFNYAPHNYGCSIVFGPVLNPVTGGLPLTPATAAASACNSANNGNDNQSSDGNRRTNAVYGQITYDLSDFVEGLSFTGGYRYTWDKVYSAFADFSPVTGRQLDYNSFLGNFHAPSYTMSLDWQIAPKTMLFVTDSKGYSRGGFNPNSGLPSNLQTYQPETLDNVEAGIKTDFDEFGVKGRWNFAGYYGFYDQIQVAQFYFLGGQTTAATQNAATGHIEGVETELTLVPVDSVTLTVNGAWNHDKFDKYQSGGVDLSGAPFLFSPQWQYNVRASYTLPIDASLGTVTYSAIYTYTSKEFVNSVYPYSVGDIIGARHTLDMDVSWKDFLGRTGLDARAYVTNVLNSPFGAAVGATYDYLGFTLRQLAPPRMWGVGLKYSFGGPDEAPATPAAAYVPPPVVAPAPSVPNSYLVFFDFNKSDLTPQAVTIVNQAAANAGPAKVTQLTVTGHTDTVGSDAYNMRLSRRRAESVAAQLEKDGIASSEIAIVAKGKRDLLVPTADGVKEPQNRRVQIVYSGGPTS